MVGIYGAGARDTASFDPVTHISSRRSSWIKRLSSRSNSQPPSRNPSPAPPPSSVAYSNGSMAFSHDSSTVPVISKRSSSPLPPNKLVKRSSSVRMPHQAPVRRSTSLRPSFRRPATSHQRSAALQHQSALLEMTVEHPSPDQQIHRANTESEIEYAHFFTTKMTKDQLSARKRRSLGHVNGFRRIFPDDKHKPTLMLARSVTVGAEEVDESASDDGESVFFASRPATPLSMTAAIATQSAAPQSIEPSQFHVHPESDISDDVSRPRRSFSIGDFISSASAKTQWVARAPSRRLSRWSSQRASSAPLVSTMSKRPYSTSYGDARRDLTDPALAKRDIATAGGAVESSCARNDLSRSSSSSPLSALPDRRVEMVAGHGLAPMPQLEVIASAVLAANQTPPSPTLAQSRVRPSRHSMAPSEQASTLVGSSDNEVRPLGSGDEDDADFLSETLFDSLRTGVTRSTSSGARGPRIETIFDESPPAKIKITALRDLLPPGIFGEHTINGAASHQSIAEEAESISTPVRTVRLQRSVQDSFSFSPTHNTPSFPTLLPSSPPSMPKPLSLGTLEWDSRAEEDDNSSRWSLDEELEDPWVDLPTANQAATPASLLRQHPHFVLPDSSPKPMTPQHFTAEHSDRDARSSIFDWSEQQPPDITSGHQTPPRPRTVHGKKDADRRGSRPVGRRAPSGLHARSQSVPVVPDVTGKRSTVVTNKFGTWGVGSKGVTEDWNDDFDFSELVEDPAAEGSSDGAPRIDGGLAMVVPKTIQEQQNNVLANIGLLREWGLLIEELKEHRIRATTLGIVDGPHSGIWEEVDAMIDLADQEADQEGVAHLSPPSSPGFDEGAFEDASNASPSHNRRRRKSGSPHDDLGTQSVRPRRKTILPPNHEIFAPQSSPILPKSKFEVHTKANTKPIITRPRKDSEAKARLVIEALQKKKTTYEPTTDAPPTPSSKKVPFDTATLRRIVPYVSTLTRRVKDAIRDAEGLYSSPGTSPPHEEPPFSKIFQQDAELAAQMKLMTVM